MELKGDPQFLIERAWALHDGLTHEINNSDESFCALCCENGRFCNLSDASFQEKHRLIAIRDSVKDVADVLMLLQRLKSWHLIDRHATLTRLEERRAQLIERAKEYKGRSVDVVKELNSSFINHKTAFEWKLNGGIKKKVADSNKEEKRRSGLITCCIKMLFNPWKWQKAFLVAAKLVVVSASISSTVRLCHANRQHCSSSTVKRSKDPLSNSFMDVFSGRG